MRASLSPLSPIRPQNYSLDCLLISKTYTKLLRFHPSYSHLHQSFSVINWLIMVAKAVLVQQFDTYPTYKSNYTMFRSVAGVAQTKLVYGCCCTAKTTIFPKKLRKVLPYFNRNNSFCCTDYCRPMFRCMADCADKSDQFLGQKLCSLQLSEQPNELFLGKLNKTLFNFLRKFEIYMCNSNHYLTQSEQLQPHSWTWPQSADYSYFGQNVALISLRNLPFFWTWQF